MVSSALVDAARKTGMMHKHLRLCSSVMTTGLPAVPSVASTRTDGVTVPKSTLLQSLHEHDSILVVYRQQQVVTYANPYPLSFGV
jgi:hypothetical protein